MSVGSSVRAFGIVLAAILFGITAAKADGRVALVIGNGAYQNLSTLTNPVSDAKAVAESLRVHGFQVFEHYDIARGDLLNALEDFQRAADTATVAIVYYAGHGMELAGKNVLAPIDTEVTCEPQQARRTVLVDDFFQSLGRAKNQVVLLDACRNDPFPQCAKRGAASGGGFRGLQRVADDADTSLIIANSTRSGDLAADGEAGGHSPFATALLSRFDADGGVPLRDMLDHTARDVKQQTDGTQVPEISTQGGAPEVCLNAACNQSLATATNPPETVVTPPPTTRSADDKDAYEAAIAVGSCGALQSFVTAYPSSFYASLAKERAAQACAAPQEQQQAAVQPQQQPQPSYSGDFIFPDSSARRLTRDDLAPLSGERLRIARNEIYARNGRFFRDQNLASYFSQYSWYQPKSWDPPLNATEKYNVRLIQQEEKRR